jgi:cyclohexadienyl dehydratase
MLRPSPSRWLLWLLLASLLRSAAAADTPTLRVGTTGDYPPFSVARTGPPGEFSGFDVAVARAYAKARGLGLELVEFAWPELLVALAAKRFDVAMSGVTVRPERSAAGRFSVPVAEGGALALVRPAARCADLGCLDRPGVRIGVNAGGHLEHVTRARFPRATTVAIPENPSVAEALRDGRVDAVVTDTFEAPLWLPSEPGWAALGPFTGDRKAYLVRPGSPTLARDLDAWLLDAERDGTLATLRRRHLGDDANVPTAAPLLALLAAVDERLSLMPAVAAAKRRAGLPLEDPDREILVREHAISAVAAAAARAATVPPPRDAIERFFQAQMDAAKGVQRAFLADPVDPSTGPAMDVPTVLRPALERIGDRMADLIVRLPERLDRSRVRRAATAMLRTPGLSAEHRAAIAEALAALRGVSAAHGAPPPPGPPSARHRQGAR